MFLFLSFFPTVYIVSFILTFIFFFLFKTSLYFHFFFLSFSFKLLQNFYIVCFSFLLSFKTFDIVDYSFFLLRIIYIIRFFLSFFFFKNVSMVPFIFLLFFLSFFLSWLFVIFRYSLPNHNPIHPFFMIFSSIFHFYSIATHSTSIIQLSFLPTKQQLTHFSDHASPHSGVDVSL